MDLYLTISANQCSLQYTWATSGISSTYYVGCLISAALFLMGGWCLLFASSDGKINRRYLAEAGDKKSSLGGYTGGKNVAENRKKAQ